MERFEGRKRFAGAGLVACPSYPLVSEGGLAAGKLTGPWPGTVFWPLGNVRGGPWANFSSWPSFVQRGYPLGDVWKIGGVFANKGGYPMARVGTPWGGGKHHVGSPSATHFVSLLPGTGGFQHRCRRRAQGGLWGRTQK